MANNPSHAYTCTTDAVYKGIYPAMTAFTDQYSLPKLFFYIGQL
jgi:hypothetical protein